MTTKKQVAILLCTHQGQRFLCEQLTSIENQTHSRWKVWASDDASNDKTKKILREFQNRASNSRISICKGPADGFVTNFLSMACKKNINADFFAFADQDDIWKPDKLERALRWFKSIPESEPALYCSRTELIDSSGKHIGFSPLFKKSPSFQNALIQNIGGGNTMVFNQSARELLITAGIHISVVSHDWWAYQLVTGAGGRVHYDAYPSLLYRQHETNLIGMNTTWTQRLKRIRLLFKGRFREWNDKHTHELHKLKDLLTSENRLILDLFIEGRQEKFLSRLYKLHKSGIYRQTRLGNLGLIAATLLKKL